jgi:hypothetical protein
MIHKDEARALAMTEILRMWGSREADEPVILDEFTIEREFGWVFFWDSRRHQETQLFEHTQAGNAPIIVNKFDGSLHQTGTAFPTENYILEYEEQLRRAKNKGEI